MLKFKWLIFAASALLLLLWSPKAALSQAPGATGNNSTVNYVVITLDRFVIDQISPTVVPVELKLMLGAVSASGSRVQKALWPTANWLNGSPGQTFLADDHSAVPLLALPESQLGDVLGFALIFLDKGIPRDQRPEDWLNTGMSAVLEAAAEPVSRWVTDQSISAEDEVNRISERIKPHLDSNSLIGVVAAKFEKNADWGVRDQPYETEVSDPVIKINVQYRIQRVSVPQGASVDVRLKGVTVQKTGRSDSDPAQVFLWTRAASGFAGEGLNDLVRRLPFADFYPLRAGQSQALDEVLYSGDLGAFLYTELGVWDQQPNGSISMGALNDLWAVEELTQEPPGDFSVTVQGSNGAQVKLDLSIQPRGLPPAVPVLVVDQMNDLATGTSFGCGTLGLSLFQSLTPTVSPLAAVSLRLSVGGRFPKSELTTAIRLRVSSPTGVTLQKATATIAGSQTAGEQLLVQFKFLPTIAVAPGSKYVIEWLSPAPAGTTAGAILTWMGREDNPYPNGSSFGCGGGKANSKTDFNFITFTER